MVLLSFYCTQGEFDDKEGWSPRKAAALCLMLVAQCYQDDVLQYVFPFIEANIEREDWKSWDAAVIALGTVIFKKERMKYIPRREASRYTSTALHRP